MDLTDWWSSVHAYRRLLLRAHKASSRRHRAQLARHFRDPGRALAWIRFFKGSPKEKKLRLLDGFDFHFRAGTADCKAMREVFIEDIYRLSQFGPLSLECVVDVGAHIGTFARWTAGIARTLICLEPVSENYRLLTRNLPEAHFPRVRLFQKAVAGSDRTLRIRLSEATYGHSAFCPDSQMGATGGYEDVAAVSVPSIMADEKLERISLLKLDCEGAEYEIVNSLRAADLLARIDRIFVEYHPIEASAASATAGEPGGATRSGTPQGGLP